MAAEKFDYDWLKGDNPLLYRQLIYEIARLFVEEHRNYTQILNEIYKKAARDDSPYHKYYNENGKDDTRGPSVPRHIKEAIRNQFITLGSFRENILSKNIKHNIDNANQVSLNIAPDEKSLLQQVCFDFDRILIEKVKSTPDGKEVVIGVSGGLTMMGVAQTLHDIKERTSWYKRASEEDKNKVVVCSLTSGGTRDNFKALSDTVAANIAQELDVKGRGLLGPPTFRDIDALNAFKDEPEIQEHIKRVENAKIILTSVGDVHNDKSLTSHIFNVIDPDHLAEIRRDHDYIGDILYQCYDGYTGEIIPPSQKIKDRIFSVIPLIKLKMKLEEKKEKEDRTRCIIVAKGYDKGKHTLRGAIIMRLASDIYMDIECALGLSDISELKNKKNNS
jgi:DNA-binding transcriptional regulator LsrR (DeoR family)